MEKWIAVASMVVMSACTCADDPKHPEDGGVLIDASLDAATDGGIELPPDAGDTPFDPPTTKQQGSQPRPTQTAQRWDYNQLPLAIEMSFEAPGRGDWGQEDGVWFYAIWPRDVPHSPGHGAWYRMGVHSTWSLYKRVLRNIPYSCAVQASPYPTGQFVCRDYRGATWYEQCPPRIQGDVAPNTWRASYNSAASQQGWFYWEATAEYWWKAWGERLTVPLKSLSVTDSGKQINCNYPPTKPFGGPLDEADIWVMWR